MGLIIILHNSISDSVQFQSRTKTSWTLSQSTLGGSLPGLLPPDGVSGRIVVNVTVGGVEALDRKIFSMAQKYLTTTLPEQICHCCCLSPSSWTLNNKRHKWRSLLQQPIQAWKMSKLLFQQIPSSFTSIWFNFN